MESFQIFATFFKSFYSCLNRTKLSKIFEQLTFVESRRGIQLGLVATTQWGTLYLFAQNQSHKKKEIFVLFPGFILSTKSLACSGCSFSFKIGSHDINLNLVN